MGCNSSKSEKDDVEEKKYDEAVAKYEEEVTSGTRVCAENRMIGEAAVGRERLLDLRS